MTIDKKFIHRARNHYRCVMCGRLNIAPGDSYWSMFGMADAGDKPYRIKVCLKCDEWSETQTQKLVGTNNE